MAVQPLAHRFTVEEFERMGTAGVFDEGERLELLDGEIVEMTPIGVRHAACVNRLTRLFTAALGERAIVAVQNPAVVNDYTMPQPDLALLVPRLDFYGEAHPRPSDVLLLVEVADSSLAFEHRVKLPLYAAGPVRELWIVDLVNEVIESYTQPASNTFGVKSVASRAQSLAPQAFPTDEFAVTDILG